jgi:peptidoglycan hydrolase-like protein with peptidoglycan-binding domain
MTKIRSVAALLAISSLAVLPACSMFGSDRSQTSSASYTLPQSSAVSPQLVQQVQQKLQQQGMYDGQIDGVWGPATQTAVRSYQQQHNLSTTGQLDADTLASLNLSTNQNYGSNTPAPNTPTQPNASATH